MSQKEFGNKFEVSFQIISGIENDSKNPSGDFIEKFYEMFDNSV